LQSYLPNVLPALIKQLDLDLIHDEEPQTGFSVLNNACWSCGKIAVPISRPVVSRSVIISNEEVIDSVNENAALAIGIGAPNRWPEYLRRSLFEVVSRCPRSTLRGKGFHVSLF
jgi:hypothetical protein